MDNRVARLGVLLMLLTGVLVFAPRALRGQSDTGDERDPGYTKQTYTYKVVGRHEIQADVYRYPGEEIRPAILWIHGGALIVGTREGISDDDQLKEYLKAGFAVVAIDYRLAPETKLPEIIRDLEDAWAWLRKEGPGLRIDPERVAVIGHSAGGYLTLMAGFRLQPRPDALVSFYGYGDITGPWYSQPDSFYNLQPAVSEEQARQGIADTVLSGTPRPPLGEQRGTFYLYCRQQGIWPQEVSGHDPAREPEWFKAYEPLRNVTPEYPPTILLHGEKDTDVPFEQSVRMAEALRRHGVPHEFVRHPDWGHSFDNRAGIGDPSVREAYDRVLAFLKTHVR